MPHTQITSHWEPWSFTEVTDWSQTQAPNIPWIRQRVGIADKQATYYQWKGCQHHPTRESHKSAKTRMWVTHQYIYDRGWGRGLNSLLSRTFTASTFEWQGSRPYWTQRYTNKYLLLCAGLKCDKLQFQNIFAANKIAMSCRPIMFSNCITETIQVTEGHKYYPLGSQFGKHWYLVQATGSRTHSDEILPYCCYRSPFSVYTHQRTKSTSIARCNVAPNKLHIHTFLTISCFQPWRYNRDISSIWESVARV